MSKLGAWWAKWWHWIVYVLLAAAAVTGIGFTAPALAGSPSPASGHGGCPNPPSHVGPVGARPATSALDRALGRGSAAVKLRAGQKLTLGFGRSTTARSLTVLLDYSGQLKSPGVALNSRVDPFIRDDDAPLHPGNITAAARVDGQSVILTVCFGRRGNHLGDPGTYTGSVTLDDNRMAAPVTVPVTVTMQYVHGVVLLWLLAFTVLPGTWVLWVVHSRRDPGVSAFAPGALLDWVVTVGGIVAVVTGGVAAFAVYTASYLKDPTWGTSALQFLTLFGAMFSAFITSAGVTQLGRIAAPPTLGDEKDKPA